MDCCGEDLRALNEDHLRWLEEFIASDLRERKRDPETG